MAFLAPPSSAAWRHEHGRSGFEVAFFHPREDGLRIQGCTTAIEGSQAWMVDYEVVLDTTWTTRRAQVVGRSASGPCAVLLEADGAGHWLVDGEVAPALEGCLDVDLEASAMTNALPVHRLDLPVGGRAPAPAAFVHAIGLSVERLEQTYTRAPDEHAHRCYDYEAPAFAFACRLVFDASGLVLDYPGIAVRSG